MATAWIRRAESVIRYTILSGRAKSNADFALIAQGRQVMRGFKITQRPEDNTKDLKITLVIWSKSADKHLTKNCTLRDSNQ